MKAEGKQPTPAPGNGHGTVHPEYPMQCEDIQAVLFDYMTRELGDARSALVRAHLRKCSTCQAEAAEIQKTLDLLREASSDDSGLATFLSQEHRDRMSRAVMHPLLSWIYCHHILVSIIVAVLAVCALAAVLRHTTIWRKDRPEPGPPVIIGEPPPPVPAAQANGGTDE